MKRARPDDDGRALVMTPARLASELHRLGEDAAKLQFRLRSLAAFLDREPIELIHDTLRTQACRLVDLATAVRVGEVPIVAHRDESIVQEALPLFEPIAPEAIPDAIGGAMEAPKSTRPKRGRKTKSEPPTEDANGQTSQRSVHGQSDGVDSLEGIETPDVGASDGPAADADAWRQVPLARILPDGLADALKLDWEMETLDDLHQALSNGETLEDFVFTPTEAGAIREAVAGVAREQGWGPEDGIPLAWLEPKAADDKQDGRPVFVCRGCGESWMLEKVKGDIPHVCDNCRPDFYLEWLAAVRGIIATELGTTADALPEIPDKIARHAFRLPLSPHAAAPTIVVGLRWTAETVGREKAEPFDFCSLHGGVKPGDEIDTVLRLAMDLLPRSTRDQWRDTGASDATIRDQLGSWWGLDGRSDEPARKPGGYCVRGGTKPALWVGDPTPTGKGGYKSKAPAWARPTLQGPALVDRVRKLLSIPRPAKAPKTTRSKKGASHAHA